MNIIQAIGDEQLFKPFFNHELESWKAWAVALRCLYGLPIKSDIGKELILQCTGRPADSLPSDGFASALLLTGRRSGKSRIAATIGAYEALFGKHEERLAKGEVGTVAILSPSKEQSKIVWTALKAIFSTPLLTQEIVDEKESDRLLVLSNGIQIKILVGDWKTVRGFTLVCAIVDEICFLQFSEEFKVRSDLELIRALKPGLATTKGKLICISSKYARKGWAYTTWLKQHGSNQGSSPSFVQGWSTLVWDAPSRTMNPTLSQAVVDAAMQEDMAAARSEYGGEWRDDVAEYVPRSLVESLVIRGRKELLPRFDASYFAFVDCSGGRADAAALAIGHKEGRKTILDLAKLWRAPHSPTQVIGEMADCLKRFSLRRVQGDNYSGEFAAESFKANGISYTKCPLPKAKLYLELLPVLCSAEIELLDDEVLIGQISGLERRTRSGGQDIVDHGPNAHDDLANCVAGCATMGRRATRVGNLFLAAA